MIARELHPRLREAVSVAAYRLAPNYGAFRGSLHDMDHEGVVKLMHGVLAHAITPALAWIAPQATAETWGVDPFYSISLRYPANDHPGFKVDKNKMLIPLRLPNGIDMTPPTRGSGNVVCTWLHDSLIVRYPFDIRPAVVIDFAAEDAREQLIEALITVVAVHFGEPRFR